MIRLLRLPGGLAATLLTAVCLSPLQVAGVPSVNVAMKAAFNAPPYLLELLEAAAGENATSYFPLLDRVAEGTFAQARTDEALYEKFLEVLREDEHMTPESLSTFKLELALRSAAPRIEAHYQYYATAIEPSITDNNDCKEWAVLGGKQFCSPSLSQAVKSISGEAQSQLPPFDRTLGNGPVAVLYADITRPEFAAFHKILAEKARNGQLSYRLRYKSSELYDFEPLPVSGYGIELQLKRTDYIVIDDRESSSDEEIAKAKSPVQVVLDEVEEVADLKPLSSSEVSSLGLKAASFIMQSDNPFQTLIKLTQDFPKFSASIAAHNASTEFSTEQEKNLAQMVSTGVNVLWMNGVQLLERSIDPYSLVDSIRRERKLIHGVTELGMSGKEAISLLSDQEVTEAKAEDNPPRFDWRDNLEEGRVIIWLNNLEKDKRYAEYPSQLRGLMQRTMPGQVPPIKKDIFNLLVPVDFSNPADIFLVAETLQGFIKRLLPIRFGLVPLTPTKMAEDQAKVVYHLIETYGLSAMMAYLDSISHTKDHVEADHLKYNKVLKERSPRAEATVLQFKEVLSSEHHKSQIKLSKSWIERANADGKVPPVFINGHPIPRDQGWLQAMSMKLTTDLQMIQQGIYFGRYDDTMWLPGVFLEGAAIRRNEYIYPDTKTPLSVLNINKLYTEHEDLLHRIPIIEANEDASKESWATLTIVADLSTEQGLNLLFSALTFRQNNPGVRLDIINNPLSSSTAHKANAALKKHVSELRAVESRETLEALMKGKFDAKDENFEVALSRFLDTVGFAPGTQVILFNGRVVGPLGPDARFTDVDFQTLFDYEQNIRILPVYNAVKKLGLTDRVNTPLDAAKVTSITALSTISDLPEGIFESAPTLRTALFDGWSSSHTMIEVGDAETANIQFVALLNPASEQGQQWAPILKTLSELDGVHLRIFLNPKDKLQELPVKRFYRYVFDSAPSFDESGKVRALGATFKGLPSEALLNLGMNVPPAWLVAAKESVHDLDNLKLSAVKTNVDAIYELEHILIEGHSREGHGAPPRGVQLLLGTERDPHFADTIIMANVGYFQFKANPGFYNIRIKDGRSSEVYTLESVGAKGFNAVPGDEGTEVALMDFKGTTLYPRLNRKPGKEEVDVLEDSEGGDDMISKGFKFAEGLFGGSKKPKSVSAQEHAEINIFSVASGHLYERMLNIMMVSVMRHTNHTVKFWFIEQFLSPSFKEFIPALAAEYGFKYEMVTYKWPHWLRQQHEKQREIWGYKILFLDVLFPLSLDKVIFVDADQIVRTDMIDLVNHDLDGAPYGFTPMCDSRTEMEGFRFWKQGYWQNYLRGLPYHISALYVVDLRRFRELAAGDRLRQQYHSLSADPGSLSNLDQDLPNHMQFQIPIHSLPQEWLWCETWCSDESLKDARTIDLCNNPLTKEPKLDRARRQVPEWTVYDDEIAAVAKKIKQSEGEPAEEVPGGEGVERVEENPKSRRFEEPEATPRKKDEL